MDKKKFQKGISLYFVVITIMVMLSSIVVLSNILYIRTKMIKDAGDSVIAFYAADSGIEKFLYLKSVIAPTKPSGYVLPSADPRDGSYYLMDAPAGNIYTPADPSNVFYGYKTNYTPGAGPAPRTLTAIGKYAKIKRGIIVKW